MKLGFIRLSSTMSVKEAKAALRKKIAKRLENLSREEICRQSKVVFDKLVNLPVFKNSKRISVYLSMNTEVDTEHIVRRIFEQGQLCFVPRYSKSGMQMVRLLSMEDWENLPLTKWHIKQPLLKENREDALETGGLDLVICPGVAFTKDGHRLGHGGGYYDKYLRNLQINQSNGISTVGIGLKEQIVDEIPVEDTDLLIDTILFDDK
ncbi:5-formyltetrahydrofolate cyclo-ligase [Sitophilus oryzae]|uniref:5-formyltetrahydrofolate cyclo-ligase n=1 Tax=Sitophilus oryzae TaxID=7048 RepID=A0A6J2XFR4_SITOR|nr:5-formyltetrahydrofolate cyclo-ligase [Sitophilus oryzae]XP_030749795.1 5-formyltetrahydrofolate cyclo-ligase [Sitophilus oryzae]XP_030749797.1 5-formyltetrahydrofolate cyclo-ligase [Sitophilus oryzae]XP_030749798.1 5-formyltetrahydrofolate cyclo-ligase [Sitophilus oryzae]